MTKYSENIYSLYSTQYKKLNTFSPPSSPGLTTFSQTPSAAAKFIYEASINIIANNESSGATGTKSVNITGGTLKVTVGNQSVTLYKTGNDIYLGLGQSGTVTFSSGRVSTNLFSSSVSSFNNNSNTIEVKFQGLWKTNNNNYIDLALKRQAYNAFTCTCEDPGGGTGPSSNICTVHYIPPASS